MIAANFSRENPNDVRENGKKKSWTPPAAPGRAVIGWTLKSADAQKADSLRLANKLSKQIGRDRPGCATGDRSRRSRRVRRAARGGAGEQSERILKTRPEHHDAERADRPRRQEKSKSSVSASLTPDFPVPYHTEIMERFNGIDLDAARRVAGNGFYYLMGDIARLHSAVIAYARDFMIDRRLHVCDPAVHDPQRRRHRRHELRRNGFNDVQD